VATLRDAAFHLERAPEGAGWGLVLSRLSPKDVARFERRLDKLLDDFRAADLDGGAPYRFVSAFWPTVKRNA
jgi:hypothetical protein